MFINKVYTFYNKVNLVTFAWEDGVVMAEEGKTIQLLHSNCPGNGWYGLNSHSQLFTKISDLTVTYETIEIYHAGKAVPVVPNQFCTL